MWWLVAPALAGEPAVGGGIAHLSAAVDGKYVSGSGWEAHVRYGIAESWAVEGAVDAFADVASARGGAVWFLGSDAYYVRPFVDASGGVLIEDDATRWLADVGVGLDVETLRFLDLRADAHYRLLGALDQGAFVFGASLQLHPPRPHDVDLDGIADRDDACMTEAEDADGFEDADGCPDPDNDGDGIADADDGCPDQAEDDDGHEDKDGCPDEDNDGDGLLDAVDVCRDVAEDPDGFSDADGCPDLDDDADRIADADDRCPYEPETWNGWEDADGCPDWLPDDIQQFTGRLDGIYFDPGEHDLQPRSRRALDNAARILQAYPDVQIEVQGHTDDRGEEEENLALSQRRAEAVVAALVERGIAAERLVAKGYGESRPVVPNTTEANRERNRRVMIELVEFDPTAPRPELPPVDGEDALPAAPEGEQPGESGE